MLTARLSTFGTERCGQEGRLSTGLSTESRRTKYVRAPQDGQKRMVFHVSTLIHKCECWRTGVVVNTRPHCGQDGDCRGRHGQLYTSPTDPRQSSTVDIRFPPSVHRLSTPSVDRGLRDRRNHRSLLSARRRSKERKGNSEGAAVLGHADMPVRGISERRASSTLDPAGSRRACLVDVAASKHCSQHAHPAQ